MEVNCARIGRHYDTPHAAAGPRADLSEANARNIRAELRKVNTKLQSVADAVEVTGITKALAEGLRTLEAEKIRLTEEIAEAAQEPVAALPDIISRLVNRYRDRVVRIDQLGKPPRNR